jgi:hypothetical protein
MLGAIKFITLIRNQSSCSSPEQVMKILLTGTKAVNKNKITVPFTSATGNLCSTLYKLTESHSLTNYNFWYTESNPALIYSWFMRKHCQWLRPHTNKHLIGSDEE